MPGTVLGLGVQTCGQLRTDGVHVLWDDLKDLNFACEGMVFAVKRLRSAGMCVNETKTKRQDSSLFCWIEALGEDMHDASRNLGEPLALGGGAQVHAG